MKEQIHLVRKKLNLKKLDVNSLNSLKKIYTFVTFEECKAPKKVTEDFKKAYRKSFKEKYCCSNKVYDKKYFFKGKRMRFKIPDHPGNLYWENMEFSKWFRRKRLLLLFFSILLVIIISFVLNVFLTAMV